jgi:NAD(P)-dependent dehydrogenase (short-subunit alcohol dehydrogenase family)
VAKAALLRLTEQAALENRDSGISVFALHPGLIHTAMIDELAGDDARRWLPSFATIARDRFLPEDRLAAAVVALGSGVADALTGRLLLAWEDIGAVAADAPRINSEDERVLRTVGI